MKNIIVKFEGIDSNNRPIFKDVNSCLRYGNTEELFPHWTDEKTVLKKVESESLSYFGDTFGCEPMGSRCNVEILNPEPKEIPHLHAIEATRFISPTSGQYSVRLKSHRFE